MTCTFIFTFTHLADVFIQSDLQCIQAIPFFSVCDKPSTVIQTANKLYRESEQRTFTLLKNIMTDFSLARE